MKETGVLCADTRRVLDLVAAELFPESQGRVTGGAVLARVRELAVDLARLRAGLEVSRYAPPETDERTGVARSPVDRALELVVEHQALVCQWSNTQLELERRGREGEGGR